MPGLDVSSTKLVSSIDLMSSVTWRGPQLRLGRTSVGSCPGRAITRQQANMVSYPSYAFQLGMLITGRYFPVQYEGGVGGSRLPKTTL